MSYEESSDVIIKRAIADPDTFFRDFRKYSIHQDIEVIMQALAEKIPLKVAEHFRDYERKEYADDVFKKSLENVLTNDKGNAYGKVLYILGEHSSKPYVPELAMSALELAFAKKDHAAIFEYCSRFKDLLKDSVRLRELVGESFASADAALVIDAYPNFATEDYAKKALQKAFTEGTPEAILENIDERYPDYDAIFEKNIRKLDNPLRYYFRFYEKPYAAEVIRGKMENILKNEPGYVLYYGEALLEKKLIKIDVIERAAAALGQDELDTIISNLEIPSMGAPSESYINILKDASEKKSDLQYERMQTELYQRIEEILPRLQNISYSSKLGNGDAVVTLDEVIKTFEGKIYLDDIDLNENKKIEAPEVLETIKDLPVIKKEKPTTPVKPKGQDR